MMSTLRLDANAPYSRAVCIGYEGENVVTSITFDLVAWIETYGLGVATLLVQRHGDASAYPVPLTIEDGSATWAVTKTDCAKSGRGAVQLVYTVGEKIKKSQVFVVTTVASLDGSGDVPDPGGGGGSSVTVDSELSAESTNPVQNKVITNALMSFSSDFNSRIDTIDSEVYSLMNAGYQTEDQVNTLIAAYMQANYDNGDTRSY